MTLVIAGAEPVAPPPTNPRSVEAIDAEVAALGEQITTQEKEFEKAKVAAEKLSQQRLKLVIKARVDGDTRAATRLEQITPRVDAAEREVGDIAAILDELRERVRLGAGERLVSERAEKQAALTKAANEQLPVSRELDQLLEKVVEKCGPWMVGQTLVYSLAVDCGKTAMLRTPRQQLGDVLNGMFFPMGAWHFDKPSRPGETFSSITARFADPVVVKEKERKAS